MRGLLGRVAEPVELRLARQSGQRALLELSRPLGREAELRTGLPERPGLISAEAEAQADDVALCLGQLRNNLTQPLVAIGCRDLLDRRRPVACQQVAELGLAVL